MEKTITISLCNRVDYTQKVLQNLLLCNNVEEYNIYIFIEPVSIQVIDIAKNFAKKHSSLVLNDCKTHISLNKNRLGCNRNIYQCLHYAFNIIESNFNIHIEDDVVPAKDFLQFAEWCNKKYKNDEEVFTICGYERTKQEEQHLNNKVKRHSWYTPWGWATWKNRWDDGYGKELYNRIHSNTGYMSWDCHTNQIRGNRLQILPYVARCQNIGAVGGVHVPSAEWHKKEQFNPFWIENTKAYTNDFEEL